MIGTRKKIFLSVALCATVITNIIHTSDPVSVIDMTLLALKRLWGEVVPFF